MKIVSWNVNSVRIRFHQIEDLVKNESPDVICLQETKVVNEDFPIQQFHDLGYEFIHFDGEKSYNGVAIISKLSLSDVNKIDILGYGHKRHISVDILGIALHNFYIPAGGDEPDPRVNLKFDHKLKFLDWMEEYFKETYDENSKVIIVGDFNIAPLENDVWSHKQLLKIISHTPLEVEKLDKIQKSMNFIDSHRLFTPDEEKLYSWWSYRGREPFKSNKGRRLDHIWLSPALKDRIEDAYILKDYRIMDRPSDHVPIVLKMK